MSARHSENTRCRTERGYGVVASVPRARLSRRSRLSSLRHRTSHVTVLRQGEVDPLLQS
jgi:hypothetical protein